MKFMSALEVITLILKLVSEKLLHSDWRQKAVLILKEMNKFSRKDRLLKGWKQSDGTKDQNLSEN